MYFEYHVLHPFYQTNVEIGLKERPSTKESQCPLKMGRKQVVLTSQTSFSSSLIY